MWIEIHLLVNHVLELNNDPSSVEQTKRQRDGGVDRKITEVDSQSRAPPES